MTVKTISTEIFINQLRDTLRNPDNKICFILGAGASVESGIDSGTKLAHDWYNELPQFHSPERIAEWKNEVSFDENNIPGFYSQLFNFRYEGHPEDGIYHITSIMEKGVPGFGYTIMSQLLQRTHHNVIITTNFDTLIEEALYIFADKRALVCNHENLAHLARPSSKRPLIVKIHRGLYMDPLNQQADIAELKPQWKKVLSDIFHNYIPIVVGYGGNDGSLMNYLKEIDPCQRMYWCVFADTQPCDDIANVVERHNGCFVTTGGFNRFMFRFIDLFKLTKMHEVMEQTARERAEKLRLEFEEAGKEIGQTGTAEEKQELGKVAADFDTSDWLQWELKASATNDPKEMENIYRQAIRDLPNSHQLHFNLGCSLDEWGSYDEAIATYQKAVEIKPVFHQAWNNMGISHKNKGNYDEAIAAYTKAVEIKPDYHVAWYNVGDSYDCKGEFDEAIAAYRKAIEIKPDKHEAWSNMGISLKNKGNYDEAIAAYRKAIEIKPDYHIAWNNLGDSYDSKGEYDEAIAAYTKAVEIKPDYHKAWYNMGISYNKKGDYDKSIVAYTKAVVIKPDKHEAWYNMGESFEKQGDRANAKQCYQKAYELDPNNEDYRKKIENLGEE